MLDQVRRVVDTTEADILIVGGGPAGLMAANYLSKLHQVALIERGVLGQTTKCWVTTQRRLQKHGLDHCIFSTPTKMTAGTFLGSHIEVSGDFAVVDDQQLLKVLATRCRDRGARLEENCRLLNLTWMGSRIQAQTTRGYVRTRLVIDATGGLSPVASTFRLNHIDGFYSVYGAMLRNIRLHSLEIVLGHVSQFGDPPPVLEVFPTGQDSAYCVIFTYSKSIVSPQSLASSFHEHCQHNPFFEMTPATQCQNEKAGAIPIGRRSRRRLPGLISFGEAGIIQPPLMGTAFNEILEHADNLCLQISQSLQTTGDKLPSPRLVYPLRKRFQDRIQLPIFRAILTENVERFDMLLRVMARFPEKLLFNFFSNELTWSQVISLALRLPFFIAMDRLAPWLGRVTASRKTPRH
jgi:2-polyprenyl-6-methoxyphenol hydroxylase-like FAD-dependent oxidoreductase